MALPPELKRLFDDLPQARADREARARQREAQAATQREAAARAANDARQRLKDELTVAWDWVLTDGLALAEQLDRHGLNRVRLLGPLDPEGRPCDWHAPGARVFQMMFDGTFEVVRNDDFRALSYAHRTAEHFLETEPPAVTRAFIDAVRSGAVWQTVAQQLRESVADPID